MSEVVSKNYGEYWVLLFLWAIKIINFSQGLCFIFFRLFKEKIREAFFFLNWGRQHDNIKACVCVCAHICMYVLGSACDRDTQVRLMIT